MAKRRIALAGVPELSKVGRPQIRFMLQKIQLFLFFTFAISSHAETKSPVPAHPLRINELLASNRGGALDDEGGSSDWLELHNTGSEVLRLAKFRLTNGETEPNTWELPNIAIAPGGYHVVWMSGLDRVSLSPEALRTSTATLPFELTLVPDNAQWKYLVPSRRGEVADGWSGMEFDDSGFALGQAGFGYGDDDDATELPIGTSLVLLRHKFQLRNCRCRSRSCWRWILMTALWPT